MSEYNIGTVNVSNASAIVTGSGTLWTTYVLAGQAFMIDGTTVIYTIGSVDSDTQITLTTVYVGTTVSSATYSIVTDFTTYFNLYETDYQDKDWPTKLTQLSLRPIDTYLHSATAPIANVIYVGTEAELIAANTAAISNVVLYAAISLTANFAQGAGVYITALKGATITQTGSFTWTGTSKFSAGRYQVFVGFTAGQVTGLIFSYPEWWGALADGTTEDTVAIQSALTASLIVELQSGKTYLSGTLTLCTNQDFNVNGAIIKLKPYATSHNPTIRMGTVSAAITGARIRKGTIDGNMANQSYAGEEWSPGIFIWGSDENTIENMTITNCQGDGITIGYDSGRVVGANRNRVEYCKIYANNASRQAIAITYGNGNRLLNNGISGNIDLELNSGVDGELKNNLISGNTGITYSETYAQPATSDLSIGISSPDLAHNVSMTGNIISNNHVFAINNQYALSTQIVNNYIVGSNSTQVYLMQLDGSDHQLVDGNTFVANSVIATSLADIIRTRGSNNISVINNLVHNDALPFHLAGATFGSNTATYQYFRNNVLTGTGYYRNAAAINPSEYGRFRIAANGSGTLTLTQLEGVPIKGGDVTLNSTNIKIYEMGHAGFADSMWQLQFQQACNNTTNITNVTNALAFPAITYGTGYAYVTMYTAPIAAGAVSATAFNFTNGTGSFTFEAWY